MYLVSFHVVCVCLWRCVLMLSKLGVIYGCVPVRCVCLWMKSAPSRVFPHQVDRDILSRRRHREIYMWFRSLLRVVTTRGKVNLSPVPSPFLLFLLWIALYACVCFLPLQVRHTGFGVCLRACVSCMRFWIQIGVCVCPCRRSVRLCWRVS